MTISTTRTRNPDGTWGGWTTVIDEPTPAPVAIPARVEVVDRTDRQAAAAIQTAMRRNAFAAHSALVDHDCPDCPPGRPCWCTAGSTDPMD